MPVFLEREIEREREREGGRRGKYLTVVAGEAELRLDVVEAAVHDGVVNGEDVQLVVQVLLSVEVILVLLQC